MAKLPQVVFGTYEEFLLGYEIVYDTDGEYSFSLNMASHAHLGSIRSIAVNKALLASAGSDEYVNVFNMISRKELAVLTPHEGTVTAVTFAPDGSHLISGSQDGNISIFRCTDWKSVKSWKGAHKKPNGVVALDIHPSGKLLLSIGADHIMRVWNMVKGRMAYAVNFSKKVTPGNTVNLVSWSFDGAHYALAIGSSCEVYETETAALIYTVKTDSRISCIDLLMPGHICIGCDDGGLEMHNYLTKDQILHQVVHNGRIKCLRLINSTAADPFLVTADSSGIIRLWQWKKKLQTQKLIQEAEVNADCRIVCMALLDPANLVKKETTTDNQGPVDKSVDSNLKDGDNSVDASTQLSSKKKNRQKLKSPADKKKQEKLGNRSLPVENPSSKSSPAKKRKSASNACNQETIQAKSRKSFSTSSWTVT